MDVSPKPLSQNITITQVYSYHHISWKVCKKKAPVQVGRGGTQTARLAEAETQDQADVGSAE